MARQKRVLVVDVGGSNVKLYAPGSRKAVKFRSGPKLTAAEMCERAVKIARRWKFSAVSIGIPSIVLHGRPAAEPGNLGGGWTRFDFRKAFGKPVKLLNDAAMQALGSYEGGRMLFLGLGTGVGSALILDGVVVPLELGDLRYSDKCTLEDTISKAVLKKLRASQRTKVVADIARNLKAAFLADYVLIGGGSADDLKNLPPGIRRGSNRNARLGGIRLWRDTPRRPVIKKHTIVVA
jgi:polyphosphate glucokinase